MAYSQLFQGVLIFPDADAFENALRTIASGERTGDHPQERAVFRKSMQGDRVMLLQYPVHQPAGEWHETLSRLHILAEFAVRGAIVAAFWGDEVQLEVIRTRPQPLPFVDPGPVDFDDDYFAARPGAYFEYKWKPGRGSIRYEKGFYREVFRRGPIHLFSLVLDDSPSSLMAVYMGGEMYCPRGNRLYTMDEFMDASSAHLPEDNGLQLLADATAEPGTVWGLQMWDATQFELYRHQGFENVETPFEKFFDCLKLEHRECRVSTNPGAYRDPGQTERSFAIKTSTLYFAREVGLVKVVNPEGELILTDFDPDAGLELEYEREVD